MKLDGICWPQNCNDPRVKTEVCSLFCESLDNRPILSLKKNGSLICDAKHAHTDSSSNPAAVIQAWISVRREGALLVHEFERSGFGDLG